MGPSRLSMPLALRAVARSRRATRTSWRACGRARLRLEAYPLSTLSPGTPSSAHMASSHDHGEGVRPTTERPRAQRRGQTIPPSFHPRAASPPAPARQPGATLRRRNRLTRPLMARSRAHGSRSAYPRQILSYCVEYGRPSAAAHRRQGRRLPRRPRPLPLANGPQPPTTRAPGPFRSGSLQPARQHRSSGGGSPDAVERAPMRSSSPRLGSSRSRRDADVRGALEGGSPSRSSSRAPFEFPRPADARHAIVLRSLIDSKWTVSSSSACKGAANPLITSRAASSRAAALSLSGPPRSRRARTARGR